MYWKLIAGFVFIMIGAVLLLYHADKGLANFFFIAGIVTEAYAVILYAIRSRR